MDVGLVFVMFITAVVSEFTSSVFLKLEEKLYEISDWSAQDDISVGKGMREAKEWKDEMDKVISKVRELKILKMEHQMLETEVGFEYVERLAKDLESDLKETIESIKNEDTDRALYTLDTAKITHVNFPIFGGKDHEDFSKFKMDMED